MADPSRQRSKSLAPQPLPAHEFAHRQRAAFDAVDRHVQSVRWAQQQLLLQQFTHFPTARDAMLRRVNAAPQQTPAPGSGPTSGPGGNDAAANIGGATSSSAASAGAAGPTGAPGSSERMGAGADGAGVDIDDDGTEPVGDTAAAQLNRLLDRLCHEARGASHQAGIGLGGSAPAVSADEGRAGLGAANRDRAGSVSSGSGAAAAPRPQAQAQARAQAQAQAQRQGQGGVRFVTPPLNSDLRPSSAGATASAGAGQRQGQDKGMLQVPQRR